MPTKIFTPTEIMSADVDTTNLQVAKGANHLAESRIVPFEKFRSHSLLGEKVETMAIIHGNGINFLNHYYAKSMLSQLSKLSSVEREILYINFSQSILPFNWIVLHPSDTLFFNQTPRVLKEAITKFKRLGFLSPMPSVTLKQKAALTELYTQATKQPWLPSAKIFRVSVNFCWKGAVKYFPEPPEGFDINNRSPSKAEEAYLHYYSLLDFETCLNTILDKNYVGRLFRAAEPVVEVILADNTAIE